MHDGFVKCRLKCGIRPNRGHDRFTEEEIERVVIQVGVIRTRHVDILRLVVAQNRLQVLQHGKPVVAGRGAVDGAVVVGLAEPSVRVSVRSRGRRGVWDAGVV